MNIILLIIGFIMLIKCADLFVDGCSNVAKAFGIPTLIIGLTIVAFGTSAPEAAVSITASLKGMNDIALGNVVGSNICNLLLILGLSGTFGTLKAKKEIITRDFIYCIGTGVVLFLFSFIYFLKGETTGIVTRWNGLILLAFIVIYVYSLVKEAIKSSKEVEDKGKFNFKDIIFIVIGIAGIIFGGQLVVNSATKIAEALHISQNVIALTIVAIGTSLPELVTSVIASKKGETDIAIGNVVGSNIFNVFFILGLSSVISPISYGFESFVDIIVMLVATIGVYLLLLKNNTIDKKRGLLFLGAYAIYMVYILMR